MNHKYILNKIIINLTKKILVLITIINLVKNKDKMSLLNSKMKYEINRLTILKLYFIKTKTKILINNLK